MAIRAFELKNVGPFDDIRFKFDEHVNVFVGPNNSGKTCALMALADLIVFPAQFAHRFLREEAGSFKLEYDGLGGAIGFGGKFPIEAVFPTTSEISHATVFPENWAPVWENYRGMLESTGFSRFIPAIRFSSDYRSKGPLQNEQSRSVSDPSRHQFMEMADELEKRATTSRMDPSLGLAHDREVVQTIIDLDYRSYREGKPFLRELIERVARLASEITEGFPIHFVGVDEDKDGLYPSFRTPDGNLPLNCLSQGTQSTIQWLGQLLFSWAQFYDYAEDLLERPATLIIDEIDAHLHPSWQRRIVPALTKHFPNLQLFCSTHSPLMLAGLRAGQVQLLKRNEEGGVTVSRNESDIVGWSADEILRNFLDVPAPTDVRTVEDIERLQTLRQKSELSPQEADELEALRHTVGEELLGGPIAGEVARLSKLLTQASKEE